MSRNFTQEATTLLALQPQTLKETGDRLEAIGRLLGETCQAITDTRKLLAEVVEAVVAYQSCGTTSTPAAIRFEAGLNRAIREAKEAL